jgi:excinuclease UvrABC helicase subunit UvrB
VEYGSGCPLLRQPPLEIRRVPSADRPGRLCLRTPGNTSAPGRQIAEQIIRHSLLDPGAGRPWRGRSTTSSTRSPTGAEKRAPLVTTLTSAWRRTCRLSRRGGHPLPLYAPRHRAIERLEIIAPPAGDFDVLVGINLLRRAWTCGGDLVAIWMRTRRLLRSETSLIQTIGRAPEQRARYLYR